MNLLRVVVLGLIPLWVVLPSAVLSNPIQIDITKCQSSVYQTSPDPSSPLSTLQCCPLAPTTATKIISGLPPPSTTYPRVRLGSQCTDAAYAAKLDRAYALMRALPDSDPRSLTQQWSLHCSYCGGAFYLGNNSGNAIVTGIDIHFSWLFLPWHRFFLFFHERILQSLLGDPTFSLSFWNWDNPYTVGGGSPQSAACLTVGHNFPSAYSPSTAATYDNNRSENAKGNGRLKFPDLTFSPVLPAVNQPLYNAPAETVIASNLNVMKNAMVTGGSTTTAFMGRQYRAADVRGNPSPTGGGGSLEMTAHAGAHFWTGLDPPINIDMGALPFSARDPVFFAHHSNIDRLWQVWKDIGPILGQNRQYYSDPDFLNAEFQFYDENKDLRKVKVSDSLDTTKMGYTYQKADDAAWITYNTTRCSTLSYADTLAQAQTLSAPTKDKKGNYHLQAGPPFVIILTQPASNGAEMFLTIDGIKVNRSVNTGFDVFLSLLSPRDYLCPWKCGEYAGRFMNMASSRGRFGSHSHGRMTWSQSISAVLGNVQVPQPGPSSVVVTLLPTSNAAVETITFSSISIGSSSS